MPARPGDIGSLLLSRAQAFFEADVVTLQKTPERAAAARHSLLVQGRDELFERPIRPLADQREDPVRVVLPAAIGCRRLAAAPSPGIPAFLPARLAGHANGLA